MEKRISLGSFGFVQADMRMANATNAKVLFFMFNR